MSKSALVTLGFVKPASRHLASPAFKDTTTGLAPPGFLMLLEENQEICFGYCRSMSAKIRQIHGPSSPVHAASLLWRMLLPPTKLFDVIVMLAFVKPACRQAVKPASRQASMPASRQAVKPASCRQAGKPMFDLMSAPEGRCWEIYV